MHVAIHGKADAGVIRAFKQCLSEQCQRLGISLTFNASARQPGESRIVVIFAREGAKWSKGAEGTFETLVGQGVPILSVIANPPSARYLPQSVSHLNAFVMSFFAEAWAECLADEIVSMAWLRRRTPKVFISYKRTDSAPVASQLYERFSRLGYDVFFDEASVQRGANFQRELMWWLNDADLLVVLGSPNFPASQWCMQELTFCLNRYIGVAAIEWPKEIYDGRVSFPGVGGKTSKPVILSAPGPDQIHALRLDDFDGMGARRRQSRKDLKLEGRELTPSALAHVVAWCARQRTVGIRQRLDNLVPLARRVLQGAAPVAGAPIPGDLVYQQGSTTAFVRVVPFRPRVETIWQACEDGVKYPVSGCFYEENDPSDPRARALRWLANGTRPTDPGRSDGWIWACMGDRLL
jgi:hypothetical protein